MIFKKDKQPEEPQLIMWDREKRVFKPVKILFDENYSGFDITEHLEPKDEGELRPSSLSNIGTVYLGCIHAVNELAQQSQMVLPKEYPKRLVEWQRGILSHIFERSFDVAVEYNASHFSLFNGVEARIKEEDRHFRFSAKNYITDDYLIKAYTENYNFAKKEVKRPVEWDIHPTVNLYVPRN